MRKRLTALFLSLALLAAMAPAVTLQARAESYVLVEEGEYALAPMCAPNSRLDVADAKRTDKTNIQICEFNGNSAQNFYITHMGDGWYKITAKVSGKVLDLQMGESTSGTNVWQYTDNGTDAQRWRFLDAGDGYYYVVPKKNTDLRLDVYYEGSANGTNVQVWRANETSAQKWKLISLSGQGSAGQADVGTFISAAQSSLGKTRTDLGLPSGSWCGFFVGYCINNSDVSSALGTISTADCANALTLAKWICATQDAGVFYSVSPAHANRVRQYAGLEGSNRVQDISVLDPCPGDILVFSWSSDWEAHYFDHLAIVTDSDTYVDGNSGSGNGKVASHSINGVKSSIIGYIRFDRVGGDAPASAPKPVGATSKPDVAVNGQDVTVSWSYDGSGTSIDVYLVTAPWGWEYIKYSGTTTDNTYTFHNVEPGGYAVFTIARPNSNRIQSVWTDVGVNPAPEPAPEPEPTPEPTPEPEPEPEITIVSEGIHPDPYGGWAHYSTQNVDVDGTRVVFQMYALKDAKGNETNFVKVRDVAQIISGTPTQFNVEYDGNVVLTTGAEYRSNGSEMRTPFTGGRTYTVPSGITKIDGVITHMDCIQLVDDGGGGYTYYKLRDLGKALGFNVGWSASRGVYIETYKRYQG